MSISAHLIAAAFMILLSALPVHGSGIRGHAPPQGDQPPARFVFESPHFTAAGSRRLEALREVHAFDAPAPGGQNLIGVTRPFAPSGIAPIDSRDLDWRAAPGGGEVAHLRIETDNASGLRVGFQLATQAVGLEARFRGSGERNTVLGPLRLTARDIQRERVWGPVTFGNAVEVEVFAPAGLDTRRELFAVPRVSQLFADPREMAKAIGSADSCQVDAACYPLSEAARNNLRATALMVVTNDEETIACNGTLLRTDPPSDVPYFLTRSECILDAQDAASVNTLWDFAATTCGSNSVLPTYRRRTGGATLVARNPAKQYALLRLDEDPPSIAWFSGWDPSPVAAGTPITAVHHPMGDLRKYNVGTIVADGIPLKVQFTSGVVEKGSGGSGIFANDELLVGMLYAGGTSCANPQAQSSYWPFADMWGELRQYLRPASGARPANYSDLWWNPQESGWGVSIADHETQIFAVWYTYRQDGTPTWFVIPGGTLSSDHRLFSGTIYESTGPAFSAPFDPSSVVVRSVGSASFDFAPPGLAAGTALFRYTIGSVNGTKQIQRQPFGDAAAQWGTDFTDIWWDPLESGWGLSLAQHGNNVFGVWFTYETDGRPLFIILPGVSFTSLNTIAGNLYTTTGPYYGSPVFDPAQVRVTRVGDATLTFAPQALSAAGKASLPVSATFLATVRGHSYPKPILRQPFGVALPTEPVTPATFQLFVRLAGTGQGNVTSTPAGINCGPGTQCMASFANGMAVTLTAAAGSGSSFVSFVGPCSATAGSCRLTMSANASITATFDRVPQPNDIVLALNDPMPTATAGDPYNQPLVRSVSGGVGPYRYALDTASGGTPPPGMVVTADGLLQGTAPRSITAATSYRFGVCAIDTAGTSKCAQTSITVIPPPAVNLALLLRNPMPQATAHSPYNESLVVSVSGGTGPYRYEWDPSPSGALPPGMSVTQDGRLQGTPQGVPQANVVLYTTYTFRVCGFDSAGNSTSPCPSTSITVVTLPLPVQITLVLRAPMPPATAGIYYDENMVLSVSGGTDMYHYALDTLFNGAPPPGMSVSLNGHLTGTPSSLIPNGTTYTFGVCAIDSAGNSSSPCPRTSITVSNTTPELPPGFPTLPLGSYRLDFEFCTTYTSPVSIPPQCHRLESFVLENDDPLAFASTFISMADTTMRQAAQSAEWTCSTSSSSYTPFTGTSFTATITLPCARDNMAATFTVTITGTKI